MLDGLPNQNTLSFPFSSSVILSPALLVKLCYLFCNTVQMKVGEKETVTKQLTMTMQLDMMMVTWINKKYVSSGL